MNPAFSVVFLTTFCGLGQGLFIAVFLADWLLPGQRFGSFSLTASVLVLFSLMVGLVASFFHLGRPERFWRTATKWQTSWLSREVLALPMLMGWVFLYILGLWLGWQGSMMFLIGLLGVISCFVLFYCTGMIYRCIEFIQEWASPLTLVNFTLLGLTTGMIYASAIASIKAPELLGTFASLALLLLFQSAISRGYSLLRNDELKPKSTTQSAIGIDAANVRQTSMGFMGGAFNTQEFFHGVSKLLITRIRIGFLLGYFVVTFILLVLGLVSGSSAWFVLAAMVNILAAIAERWYFFAQANHPQNIYYQTIG